MVSRTSWILGHVVPLIVVFAAASVFLYASTPTNLPATKAIMNTDGSIIALSSEGQIIIKDKGVVTSLSIPGFKPNFILLRGEAVYVVGNYYGFPAFAEVTKEPQHPAKVTYVDNAEGGELLFARLIEDDRIAFVGYVVLGSSYAPIVIYYDSGRHSIAGAQVFSYRLPMYFRDVIKDNEQYIFLGGIAYGGGYYPVIVWGKSLVAYIPSIQGVGKGYHIKGILTANGTATAFFMIHDNQLIVASATNTDIKSWLTIEGVNDAQLSSISGDAGQWIILAHLQDGKTFAMLSTQTCIEFQQDLLGTAFYEGHIVGITDDLSLVSAKVQKSCPVEKSINNLRALHDEIITHNVSCVSKEVNVTSKVFHEEQTPSTTISEVPSLTNTSLAIGEEYAKDVWVFEPNYYLMAAGILLILTSYLAHKKLGTRY